MTRLNRFHTLLGVFVSWLCWVTVAAASPEEIIAKARAYLGGEENLNGVRSIRYFGTVETTEQSKDGTKVPVTFDIEIIFQKEYRQRVVVTKSDLVETTALDDYEGWHRIQQKGDESRWRTVLFQPGRVKQLRASTWENLAFFKGIETVGGQIVDHGLVSIEGKQAYKIGFVHEPGIVYARYFDPETGKLLYTETDQGVRIREEGEFTVGGIKFPQRIINMSTPQEGEERVVIIAIKDVAVNETYPDDYFRVPLTSGR